MELLGDIPTQTKINLPYLRKEQDVLESHNTIQKVFLTIRDEFYYNKKLLVFSFLKHMHGKGNNIS